MSTTQRPANAPSHEVFAVSRRANAPQGTKARWQKIGAAWEQLGGEQLSVKLEFLPLNPAGEKVDLVIRKWKPKPATATVETTDGEG